jgi:hypothetical protein
MQLHLSNGLEDFRNVFGPGLDYGKIRAILWRRKSLNFRGGVGSKVSEVKKVRNVELKQG